MKNIETRHGRQCISHILIINQSNVQRMIIVHINTWGIWSQDSTSILDTMVEKISQQHTNLGA